MFKESDGLLTSRGSATKSRHFEFYHWNGPAPQSSKSRNSGSEMNAAKMQKHLLQTLFRRVSDTEHGSLEIPFEETSTWLEGFPRSRSTSHAKKSERSRPSQLSHPSISRTRHIPFRKPVLGRFLLGSFHFSCHFCFCPQIPREKFNF